jgi:hypothetical protein
MAIGDDFSIDYTNKRIHHSSGTTVYSVNQLYSWLQDQFDELSAMDDLVPMSAQTPTAYTMINGWWLDIGENSYAIRYLDGGAIQTNGQTNVIRLLKLESGGYTNAVVGDIGREVGYSGGTPDDTGTLLDYDNTLRFWWVRQDDTGDTFSNTTTALDLDNGTGTGAGNIEDTGGTLSGDDLFANIFSVGAVTSNPSAQVYIIQDGSRVAEWSGLTGWDRGHIDMLIQVDEAGVQIDSRNLRVFNRLTGDSFSHFDPTVTTAGQNVAALATVTDGNDDDVEWYMLYDTEAGGGFTDPSTGEYFIQDTATGTKPSWYAVLVTLTDYGTSGLLGLKGLNGVPANNDAIYEGATQKGTVNMGATKGVGDAVIEYTGGTDPTTDNQILTQATSGATSLQRGYDATGEVVVVEVDRTLTGTSRDSYYVDYNTTNLVTGATTGSFTPDSYIRGIAGMDDITVAHVNGTATHGGVTGTFTPGERVVITGGLEGIVLEEGSPMVLANVHVTATGAPATDINTDTATGDISTATATFTQDLQLGHVTNQNFTLQSTAPYAVFVEGGAIYNIGRSLKQIYEYLKFILRDGSTFDTYVINDADTTVTLTEGQAYITANETYTVVPANPYGAFTGTAFQGAQGIWVQGQAAADVNNLELTDSDGNAQAPNPTVTITIGNTVSGDRVAVLLDDGTGDVEKDMYQSHATNNAVSDNTFELDGAPALTNDTPTTGAIIVIAVDEEEEHRYRYTSFAKTPDIFTLATEGSGTAEATSSGDQLDDTGAFANAEVDDIIRNITDGTWGYIRAKTDADQVFTTTGFGSGALIWDSGDTFEYNSLIQAYDGSDTVYVPYVHRKATSGTLTQNILYVSDRTVIVRVRNVADATPIKPFEAPGTIQNTGLTQNVIRDTDTIFQ